jgi:hypothetical protein
MKKVIILFSILISVSAWADLSLATNGKKVTCYADDNQSIELNSKRTALKYTVEGESLGAKKISKTISESNKYFSYKSSAGTLVLSDKGDTFQLPGENDSFEVDCK